MQSKEKKKLHQLTSVRTCTFEGDVQRKIKNKDLSSIQTLFSSLGNSFFPTLQKSIKRTINRAKISDLTEFHAITKSRVHHGSDITQRKLS